MIVDVKNSFSSQVDRVMCEKLTNPAQQQNNPTKNQYNLDFKNILQQKCNQNIPSI